MLGTAPLFAFQEAEEEIEVGDEKKPADAAEANKKEETTKQQVLKPKTGKSLYFLGVRPELKRQQGPAIGQPTSILPQPFVPKGSVKIPPVPVASTEEDKARLLTEVDALSTEDGATTPDLQASVGEDINANLETLRQEGTESVAETSQSALAVEGLLEAGVLKRLDPSGVAVSGAATEYATTLWQGYDRAAVMMRLSEFSETAGSPALVQIANKIALSGTVFEGEATDAEVFAFVEARLTLLRQLGNVQGYIGLLEALPNSYDWTKLSRHYTNAYLLNGKIADACSLASEQRENDDDAYWLRLVAFCEAARGNRAGVDFQLGILEEVSDVQPTFYQLIDQILVEAEQPPGAALPATVSLPASLRVDVLEATMARLARVTVTELAREAVNPLAVGLVLSLPGVTDDAKIELMGVAVRRGWASGELFSAFARNLDADSDIEQAAMQLTEEDDSFNVDAVLFHMAANPASVNERSEALKLAWARALKNSYTAIAGQGLLVLAGGEVPTALESSIMTRAALIAGQDEVAGRWFLTLRSQQAGTSEDLDAALVSIAPLMTIQTNNETSPTFNFALLERWWQQQGPRTDRFERANLLFTILEALGATIEDEAWAWLENGPVAFEGTVPSPAQWRRFLIAANNGDTAKALSFAFRLLSEGGTSSVPASLAGSLIGTLNGMGLRDEARMIATEILISQGL